MSPGWIRGGALQAHATLWRVCTIVRGNRTSPSTRLFKRRVIETVIFVSLVHRGVGGSFRLALWQTLMLNSRDLGGLVPLVIYLRRDRIGRMN